MSAVTIRAQYGPFVMNSRLGVIPADQVAPRNYS